MLVIDLNFTLFFKNFILNEFYQTVQFKFYINTIMHLKKNLIFCLLFLKSNKINPKDVKLNYEAPKKHYKNPNIMDLEVYLKL